MTTTHVLTITDMSGSMAGLAQDVRGGFNAYVEELAAKLGNFRLTATVFDTEFISLCTNAKLSEVPRLTHSNYLPRGCTALLDAVGRTIAEFDARVPQLGDGDRVLVVIQTDGHENSSVEFTWKQISGLIKQREATGAWSFIYLGAGADTWDQAQRMGITHDSYVNTAKTSVGTRTTYSGLATATVAYNAGATGAEASGIVASTAGVKDPA